MNQRTLMVLIGPSGSGKTYKAENYIKKNPHWIRVSRDDLRLQLLGKREFGSYFLEDNANLEKHITHLQMEQIRYWLSQGFSVIVDNPHLKTKYLQTYMDLFGHLADLLFVPILNVDPLVCKERIRQREGEHVDVSYIDRHFAHFKTVLEEAAGILDKIIPRSNELRYELGTLNQQAFKDCIIVDIDGTVADASGIRSIHEGEKIHLDRPIYPVNYLLNKLKSGMLRKPTVIYLTGREEQWRYPTIEWLKDHQFPWDGMLLMREDGDPRPDALVKQDLFMDQVAGRYRPVFVIEDHLQVCHALWYKLGVFCLNVNQGLRNY